MRDTRKIYENDLKEQGVSEEKIKDHVIYEKQLKDLNAANKLQDPKDPYRNYCDIMNWQDLLAYRCLNKSPFESISLYEKNILPIIWINVISPNINQTPPLILLVAATSAVIAPTSIAIDK